MINIYGPINMLGYGMHCNNMVKALMDQGEEVNLSTMGQVQNDPYFEAYWQQASKNKVNYDRNAPSLFIFHDEYSNQAHGSPLFVFSIFETSKLKPESVAMLKNGPADIILTATQGHKNILEAHNIGKPIEVVHEGIDDVVFNTIPVDKHIDTKKFAYITVGKKEKRKNTSLIIKSFIDQMHDKEVALIAHTFNMFANKQNVHPYKNLESWSDVNPIEYGFEYKGWDGKAHRFVKDKCDIYFTVPGIQTAEMGCLYHSANVGIQISRGEGWDLPCGELMACGIPVIGSLCLGHQEYLTGDYNIVPQIQSELLVPPHANEIADDGIWFKGNVGEWSVIDKDMFNDILIQTWNNREKYEKPSEELSKYMENNYSWSKAVDSFRKLY